MTAPRALVTGAGGVMGTALVAALRAAGQDVVALTSRDADLRDASAAETVLGRHRPEVVYHLAARVRGIMCNHGTGGEAFLDNVRINTNVVEAARLAGARKVVAMGSAAIYGDDIAWPAREADAFTGRPHASEAGYAHAKRAMLAQLEAYREQWGLAFAFCISTNLFGPHDRFDERGGHVVPSLVSKFHHAVTTGTSVTVWGSGTAMRDLLYAPDAAAAMVRIGAAGEGPINLAIGQTVTIRALAELLADISGYSGEIGWDRTKPDGQRRREYDVSRLRALGVGPGRPLGDALAETYAWYAAHAGEARR